MSKILAAILLCTISACTSGARLGESAPDQATMEFRFNGCAGELSSNDSYETTVARKDDGIFTTFLVSHAATCGLDVRHPAYSIVGSNLQLSYEMYSESGAVVMCDCGYSSQFMFTNLPDAVKSASFRAMFDEP